jgi:hypothetical protein
MNKPVFHPNRFGFIKQFKEANFKIQSNLSVAWIGEKDAQV